MVDNCHAYNKKRNPHLPPMADALMAFAMSELAKVDKDLTDLENKMRGEDKDSNNPFSPASTNDEDLEDQEIDVGGMESLPVVYSPMSALSSQPVLNIEDELLEEEEEEEEEEVIIDV